MPLPPNKLQTEAELVRLECEAIAQTTDKWSSKSLCGMCAIASVKLFDRLIEYKPQLAYSTYNRWSHVWLYVDDKIVDVTHSQLVPNHHILIRDMSADFALKYLYVDKNIKFNSKEQLVEFLHLIRWSELDIPKLNTDMYI